MSRLRISAPGADGLAHYRARAARRSAGTSVVMAAMALLAAMLLCVVLYAIGLLLVLLFNLMGEHAKGRMEQRLNPPNHATGADVALPVLRP